MILDAKKYALKYALFYTIIIAFLLFMPLFVYTSLMLQINEAKNEKELKGVALKIIGKMQSFDNKERVFIYPRFVSYRSGLYDERFEPIFTLLDFQPQSFNPGFHKQGDIRYYIVELPKDLYFGARYLIVSKHFDPWQIYRMSLLIAIGIILTLFAFSFLVLKNFAAPFNKINRALDNFIKDSMHEINTPLSIINVNIDLFARKFGSNRYLERIKAAAKTLGNIYNDMDYLIKKDKVRYEREKVDFSRFLQERIDYFQEVANLRHIKLISHIQPGISLFINRTKLQRVIDNTLSNAIKYSKENSKVEIFLKTSSEYIVLSVKDYGVGIEKPHKIFERYYRENSEKGGFGIGLNIVKNIIDEERIRLKVVSKVNKGSSFIYFFKKTA